jgi:hypothetical protein
MTSALTWDARDDGEYENGTQLAAAGCRGEATTYIKLDRLGVRSQFAVRRQHLLQRSHNLIGCHVIRGKDA